MQHWQWIAAVVLCWIYSVSGHSTSLRSAKREQQNEDRAKSERQPLGAVAPLLKDHVMMRGIDELAMAQSARLAAKSNAESAKASQQELVAEQVLVGAEAPYQKVAPLVPKLKSSALQVRRYAMEAKQHRDHAEKVAEAFFRLDKDAALRAKQATLEWIAEDAHVVAERTAASSSNYTKIKGEKLAKAVAEAAEPYHLAQLRNQKFCAETYEKAKSAQQSYQQLVTDAKKLALEAQAMQANGLGYQALESNSMAKGMMTQAEELRQWSTKLYNQANTACSTTGGWVAAETQAAANAAAMTPVNVPMKLPVQAPES